jgi:hypothetical protein
MLVWLIKGSEYLKTYLPLLADSSPSELPALFLDAHKRFIAVVS